jgi:dihydrolipoamide dehydrogenase
MIKIISGARYREVLGVHIWGPRATDLIAEAALAMRLEATLDELVSTIHAHPTIGEAMQEAALDTDGLAIHWPPILKKAL